MSIPPEYYPEWWNVNDSRTNPNLYRVQLTAEADLFGGSSSRRRDGYGGGRGFMGHFGRVGACSIDIDNARAVTQCCIDKDVMPSSYCVPIHYGLFDCHIHRDNSVDDLKALHDVALRMSKFSTNRYIPNMLLERTKIGLKRFDKVQILNDSKRIPRSTSQVLQNTNLGKLMWDEKRVAIALRNFDRQIGGNNLKCHQFQDISECFLLYPSGAEMDYLLRMCYNKQKKVINEDHIIRLYLGSPILELDLLPNDSSHPNLVVRTSSKLHFFRNEHSGLKEIHVKSVSDTIRSIRMSPFISGQYVTAGNCSASVYNLESSEPIFQSNEIHPLIYSPDDWCQSSFSSDIFKLVYCDCSQLRLTDMRSSEDLVLYSVTNLGNDQEYFVSQITKSDTMDNYHIICTNYKNCLVDQRMPERLVLEWSSALLDPPWVSDTYVVPNGLSWLLTGSQRGDEVSINCYDLKHSIRDPQAPHLVSVVKGGSRKQFLNMNFKSPSAGHTCSDRIDSASLVGLCAIPASAPDSIDCLQLTNNGDLFRQSFIVCSSSAEVNLEFSNQDKVICDNWIEQMYSSSDAKHTDANSVDDFCSPQEFIDTCEIDHSFSKTDYQSDNSLRHCIIDLDSFSRVPCIPENKVSVDSDSNFLAGLLNEFISETNVTGPFFDISSQLCNETLMDKRITEETNRIQSTIDEERKLKRKQKLRKRRRRLLMSKVMCASHVAQIEKMSDHIR